MPVKGRSLREVTGAPREFFHVPVGRSIVVAASERLT
jgi:hypothetical protein